MSVLGLWGVLAMNRALRMRGRHDGQGRSVAGRKPRELDTEGMLCSITLLVGVEEDILMVGVGREDGLARKSVKYTSKVPSE